MKQRIKLRQVVLERGAAQRQPMCSVQLENRLSHLGTCTFDVLALVQDHIVKMLLLEHLYVIVLISKCHTFLWSASWWLLQHLFPL